MAKEQRWFCFSAAIDYCQRHAQEVVFRANRLDKWAEQTPDYLDLTGYQMLLNAFGFEAGAFFNLLGSNLVDPPSGDPIFRLYNASQEDIATYQRLYDVFRSEIERSPHGWVEVTPFPSNENIIFLKGSDGAFDWVIRDQRDTTLSDNPYYPFLHKAELPSAIKGAEGLESHLHYQRGHWHEKLEHEAEDRHYKEGGSTSNWPGYAKLVQRELAASQNYVPTKRKQGTPSAGFSPVRLNNYSLLVSQLITIEDFWRFFKVSPWQSYRNSRSKSPRSVMDMDLSSMNLSDPAYLPASVTWFDAIAYCKAYEDETCLPVRLLSIEEWRQVFGGISDFERPTKKPALGEWHEMLGGSSEETDYSALPRAVAGRWPEPLQYVPDPVWRTTEHGIRCLYARDFGEWLQDYHAGNAPAVCAATEESIVMGPLERAVLPADSTMRHKGMKVGFRMCYVSRPDA